MVQGIEDLRTPLQEIIDLDKKIRGTLSGFMMPSFVIDLPGGGGKRLVSTKEEYKNGKAIYRAPGLGGEKGEREYTYYDPKPVVEAELVQLNHQKAQALENGQTLEQFARQRFFNPAASIPPTQGPIPALGQDFGRKQPSRTMEEVFVEPMSPPYESTLAANA